MQLNFDSKQPGDKDNEVLVRKPIPTPHIRVKLTGWEQGFEYIGRATDVIRKQRI